MSAVGEPPAGLDRPAERVAELARRLGAHEVAGWCAGLLTGAVAYDDPGLPALAWLGGRQATDADWLAKDVNDYWPRVWAARGLLHCWPEPTEPATVAAVVSALGDPAWRVRELAGKVAAAHEVGEAAEALADRVADPVPRVRGAALRGLAVVGESEHVDLVRDAGHDPERAVRVAAERALTRLEERLDLPTAG